MRNAMSTALIVHSFSLYVNPGRQNPGRNRDGASLRFRRAAYRALRCTGTIGRTLGTNNAIIHGTGLMGASIGLGLSAAGWEVSGWDPDPGASLVARERGAISSILSGPDEGVSEADLLVLAGPPPATIEALATLETGALVTDISSVKSPIVDAARRLRRFVPGHPMAGSASTGPEHASAHLFRGATWVLCDDLANPADIERMKEMVAILGANPVVMDAASHDERVALVSHLPRLLASALLQMAEDTPGATELSAGSFRDLTRVAGSDPDWWSDILIGNKDAMDRTIDEMQRLLGRWRDEIAREDATAIQAHLATTAAVRMGLGAPLTAVRVVLFDKPGEIGLVGRSLERSGVDLRDLHIRHAEYGGGGVLTLSVSEEEAGSLKAALVEDGFEIED
ncbi:MAG: prephenate dehydrogenase [Acidimicrobiia bacterium]